ncbi:MAG: fuculose phosphate aldolase [Acidimicrobiales bacterium]|nr:fuculose phosphate aldolase [Acidimicrobiales bacterium]
MSSNGDSAPRSVENAHALVLAAAKDMLRKGLTEGTAGNISARLPNGNIVITPSSVDYDLMTLDDLVIIDLDGKTVTGDRGPSSEKALHIACYKAFPDVGSVIHAHPVFATMFAVAHQNIPACIDEFSIYCGGEVAVTDYAMSGTDGVGDNAVAVMNGRSAALLANHGTVAVGANPGKALHVTALIERSAQIVWGAKALGPIHELPEKVNQQFAGIYSYLRQNPM